VAVVESVGVSSMSSRPTCRDGALHASSSTRGGGGHCTLPTRTGRSSTRSAPLASTAGLAAHGPRAGDDDGETGARWLAAGGGATCAGTGGVTVE